MKNAIIAAFVGAISATSWAVAEPISKTNLVQHTLRGNPITADPRVDHRSPVGPQYKKPEAKGSKEGGHENVIWPENSKVPFFIQMAFACGWIGVIGSLPFIVPLLDRQPVTKTQFAVGGGLLLVLFGGVYLFTNIILFGSVHFEAIRPLTIVECIYFMAQIITTVGYGDICPAKTRGQIFVGLYVIGALFIIAMLISEVLDHVTKAAHKYKDNLLKQVNPVAQMSGRPGSVRKRGSVHNLIAPEKPSPRALFISLGVFAAIDFVWVLFFSNWPGENKTMFQALYMSVITLSSVGFGAFTPLTEEGMVFGAFFMLLGSGALVSGITNFCALTEKLNHYERFNKDHKMEIAKNLKELVGGSDKVDQVQFFKFAVLSQKFMTEEQFNGVCHTFECLNPRDGLVDLKTVETSFLTEPPPKFHEISSTHH